MAELGAGDARWRVADMGEQGRNVNAWHWTNHDASAWAKSRLEELFAADGTTAPLVSPAAAAAAAGTPQPAILSAGLRLCKGDVELMNRKGRLIVTYELEITIGWRTSDAGEEEAEGAIEVPYFGDEHEGDDEPPPMRVTVEKGGGAAGDAARAALLAPEAKREVAARLKRMVAELKQGAPLKKGEREGLAADAAADAAAKPPPSAALPAAASKPAAPPLMPPKIAAAAADNSETDSLELEQRFHARASDLFECFTNAGKLTAWSRSAATLPPASGGDNAGFLGPFSWFGGSVQGAVTKAEANARLEMDWRFSTWDEGRTSRVVLEFCEEDGALCVRLKQTGIPHEDAHGNIEQLSLVTQGWKERVFGRIRQTFGYGTGGF